MKTSKKILASAVVASVLSVGALAPVAQAEVSASVSVASTYLWRGYDLGGAAISGDLVASSEAGLYAGLWVSSGDFVAGQEYDLFAGYGTSFGEFNFDISVISYNYPTGVFGGAGFDTEGSPGDFMEAIIALGYGPVTFKYYDNIAGETGGYAPSEDYTYMSLSAAAGAFTFLAGMHDEGANNATHIDVSYAYNDNLSFTFSTIADSDAEEDADPMFVVSYSLPIE